LPIDKTKADRAVKFINLLRHTHGEYAGKPFALRPWQEQIVRAIFGRVDAAGRRVVREVGCWLPRKQGKSELAAALALLFFLVEPEPRGEIYLAASDLAQASLIYNTALAMCYASPELLAHVKVIESQRRMVNRRNGSLLRAIPANDRAAHGFNASCVIADELHCWQGRDLYSALTTSFGARAQPLTFTITTAGLDDRTTLEHELYDYATRVRDGQIKDPHYLPVIYEAPPESDWLDEKTWHQANPALGDFRSLQEMRISAARAQRQPSLENEFKRLYLNIHTQQVNRWLNLELWDACRGEVQPDAALRWYGGLDLSSVKDTTALALAAKCAEGYRAKVWIWVPEETARQREHDERVPYGAWAKSGQVQLVPGSRIDQAWLLERVCEICDAWGCRQVGIDSWQAEWFFQQLPMRDIAAVDVKQGFRTYSAPARLLEGLVADQSFTHDGSDALRWQLGNVEMASNRTTDQIRPVKASDKARIDAVVALLMALARASADDEAGQFYDGPGCYA